MDEALTSNSLHSPSVCINSERGREGEGRTRTSSHTDQHPDMHPTGSSRAYPDQPLQQTATTPLQPPHSLAVPLSASASSSSASGSHAPPRADIASVEAISKHLKRVGKRWRGSKQCISWDFRRGSQNHEVKLTFSRLTRKLVITCDGEVVPPSPNPLGGGGGGGGGPAQAGAATTGGGGGPSEFPLRSRAYFFSSLGGSRFLPFRGGGIPVARWSKGDVDLEIEQTSARGERYTLKLNGEPFTEGKLYSSSSPFPSRHFGGPTSSLPSSSSSAHQQQIIAQQQQQQQHRQMDQRQTQRQRQQKDREGSGKLNHERETASSTRGHAGRGRSGRGRAREEGVEHGQREGSGRDREQQEGGRQRFAVSLFSGGRRGDQNAGAGNSRTAKRGGRGKDVEGREPPPRPGSVPLEAHRGGREGAVAAAVGSERRSLSTCSRGELGGREQEEGGGVREKTNSTDDCSEQGRGRERERGRGRGGRAPAGGGGEIFAERRKVWWEDEHFVFVPFPRWSKPNSKPPSFVERGEARDANPNPRPLSLQALGPLPTLLGAPADACETTAEGGPFLGPGGRRRRALSTPSLRDLPDLLTDFEAEEEEGEGDVWRGGCASGHSIGEGGEHHDGQEDRDVLAVAGVAEGGGMMRRRYSVPTYGGAFYLEDSESFSHCGQIPAGGAAGRMEQEREEAGAHELQAEGGEGEYREEEKGDRTMSFLQEGGQYQETHFHPDAPPADPPGGFPSAPPPPFDLLQHPVAVHLPAVSPLFQEIPQRVPSVPFTSSALLPAKVEGEPDIAGPRKPDVRIKSREVLERENELLRAELRRTQEEAARREAQIEAHARAARMDLEEERRRSAELREALKAFCSVCSVVEKRERERESRRTKQSNFVKDPLSLSIAGSMHEGAVGLGSSALPASQAEGVGMSGCVQPGSTATVLFRQTQMHTETPHQSKSCKTGPVPTAESLLFPLGSLGERQGDKQEDAGGRGPPLDIPWCPDARRSCAPATDSLFPFPEAAAASLSPSLPSAPRLAAAAASSSAVFGGPVGVFGDSQRGVGGGTEKERGHEGNRAEPPQYPVRHSTRCLLTDDRSNDPATKLLLLSQQQQEKRQQPQQKRKEKQSLKGGHEEQQGAPAASHRRHSPMHKQSRTAAQSQQPPSSLPSADSTPAQSVDTAADRKRMSECPVPVQHAAPLFSLPTWDSHPPLPLNIPVAVRLPPEGVEEGGDGGEFDFEDCVRGDHEDFFGESGGAAATSEGPFARGGLVPVSTQLNIPAASLLPEPLSAPASLGAAAAAAGGSPQTSGGRPCQLNRRQAGGLAASTPTGAASAPHPGMGSVETLKEEMAEIWGAAGERERESRWKGPVSRVTGQKLHGRVPFAGSSFPLFSWSRAKNLEAADGGREPRLLRHKRRRYSRRERGVRLMMMSTPADFPSEGRPMREGGRRGRPPRPMYGGSSPRTTSSRSSNVSRFDAHGGSSVCMGEFDLSGLPPPHGHKNVGLLASSRTWFGFSPGGREGMSGRGGGALSLPAVRSFSSVSALDSACGGAGPPLRVDSESPSVPQRGGHAEESEKEKMLECGGGGRGGDGKAKEHLCPFPLVPTSALSQGNFRPLSPPSNLFPPVVPGPPVSARPWASVPSVRGALLSGEGEEGESPRGALQRTRSPDTLPGGCGYASMAKAKKKMQLQPPHGHAGGGRGASMLAGHMRGSLPPAPRPLRTPAASMSFPGHGDNNPTTTSSSSSPASPTPSPDTAGAADTLAATQWVEDFFHGCSLKRASDAERGGGVQDEMQHPRLELIRVGRDGKRGTALRACSSNSPGGGSANLVGLTHAQMGGDEKQKSHDSLSRVPPESPPTGNEDDSDWHIVQGAGGALGSRGECTEDRGESESLEQKEANQNEAPKALVGEMEGEMNDEEGEGDEDIDADPEPAPPVSASLLRPHSGGKFEDGGGDGREQGAGESSVIQTPASTPLQKDKPTPREEAYPSPSPASESVSSTPLVSAAAARGPGMDPDNVNAEGPMQVPEAPRSAATAAAVGAAFPAPFYSHFGMHPHHPAAAAAFAHPAHAPLFAHAAAAESHSHAAAAYAAASGFPFFPPSFGLVSQAAAAFGAPVSSSSFHFPHAHATGGQLLSGGASTASPETNNPSCMSLLPHLYCVPLTMNNGLPAPCGTDSYSQKHTTPASAATPVPSRQTIPGHSLTQTQTQTLTQAAPPSQQGSVSLSHSHSQQQPQAAGWGPLPPSTATAASLSLSFGSTHSHAGGPSGSVSSALQTHPPPPVSHTHAGLSAHMRSRSHSLRTSELFFDLDRHHMASASSASAAMGTQQPQQFQSQPPAPLSQTHSSFHIQTAYPPPSSLYPFHQPTAASHFSHTPQNSHSHVTAPSTSTAATSANAAGAGGSPSTVPAPSSHHHQVQQQQLMQGGDRVPVDKHDASYYAKPGVPSGLGFVSSATVTSASPPSSSPVTSAAAARTTTASSSQQRFNHPHLPQQQQQQQPPRTPGGLAHHHQSQQQQQQYVQKAAATGPHGQQQGSSAVQAAAGARGSAPSHLPARATLPFPGHAHHHLTNATSTCGGAVRAQTRGGSAGAPSGVLKEPRQQQPSGDTAVSAGLGPPGPGTDSPFVSSAAGAPGGLGVHEQTQNGLSLLPPPPTLCLPSEADRHRSKAETGDAEGVAVKSGTQQGENDLNSQHDWDNGGEGGNANSIQNLPRASGSFSTVVEGLGRDRSDAGGVGPLKDAELPSAHRGVSRGGPSGVPPNSRVSVTHQAVPPSSTLSLSSPPASVVSLRNSKLSSTPSNVVSALTAPPSRPQPVPAVPPAPLTPSPNPSPSPSPGSSAGFSTAAAAAAGTDTVSNSRPPPLPPLHLSSTTTGAQTNPQQAGTYTQTYAPSVPAAASAAAGGLSFSASGSQSFVPSAHMTGGGAVPLYTGFSSAGTYASYQPTSALFQQQQQSQGGQNRPVSPPSAQSPSVPAAAVMAPPSPAHPPGSSGSATAPSSYSMPLPVALQLPLPMPLWPQFYSSSSSSSNVITSSCSSHDPVNNMM